MPDVSMFVSAKCAAAMQHREPIVIAAAAASDAASAFRPRRDGGL